MWRNWEYFQILRQYQDIKKKRNRTEKYFVCLSYWSISRLFWKWRSFKYIWVTSPLPIYVHGAFLTAGPWAQWWLYFTMSLSFFLPSPILLRQVQLQLHFLKASPTPIRILSSHWSRHDSGSNASPTLKNPGLSLVPPWIWPLIGQECLNGSSLHEVVNSQKVKSRLGCVSGRGPYLWKYPSQTPSVIYFWNPWVQTSTLLHSDRHLVPHSPPRWGASIWVGFKAISYKRGQIKLGIK